MKVVRLQHGHEVLAVRSDTLLHPRDGGLLVFDPVRARHAELTQRQIVREGLLDQIPPLAERALALREGVDPDSENVGMSLQQLDAIHRARGEHARRIAPCERVVRIYEKPAKNGQPAEEAKL